MPQAKRAAKGKRRSKAVPVLGIAGMSWAMAGGGASASVADLPPQNTAPPQVIPFSEEEISDVSLSTFYVFDKEYTGAPKLGVQTARGCGCGRGCRGCGRGCR